MSHSDGFSHLVVVGSSSGGIEALSALVSTLPSDLHAPIVIAQHLDPSRESRLREILERRSTIPVRTVTDQDALAPGVVFVMPANRHVHIDERAVSLIEDTHGRPKPSVDVLLSTAAEVYGERLVAVILTGEGSDGAAGARDVKAAGGTVIIQNPATASHPSMPEALAPTDVDIVADVEKIGPMLGALTDNLRVPTDTDERSELQAFLGELRERYGIDFATYKSPTILRRLQRRMVATETSTLGEYRRFLDAEPDEYQRLVNAFLIKVTKFFRDPELFDYLRDEVLPRLVAEATEQGSELRLWSAGCATGEEAYSLAILVSEALGDRADELNVRIFATDLDAEAVEFARRGVYSRAALESMPEELLDRYFVQEDGRYQVRKRVRALTVFGRHDLAQRAPFPRIDLVLCRNVLIYFTPELQRRALELFAYSLRDQGYLVLGKAESAAQLAEYFAPLHRQYRVFRREGERMLMAPSPVHRISSGRSSLRLADASGGPHHLRGAADSPRDQRELQRSGIMGEDLLLRLPVGVVVIDREYDIRAINGAARRLLSIHGRAVGEDLLHSAPDIPYAALRGAIDAAFRDEPLAELTEITVEEPATETPRYLQMTCSPHRSEGQNGPVDAVVLAVSDVTTVSKARREAEQRLEAASGELERVRRDAYEEARRREQTNDRLAEANRQLQKANQELTSTNEELQTTNEEYLVSAEEAQAATEEVETLNEELQATNEELETLNEELQATIEELNTTNDDLYSRSVELQALAVMLEEQNRETETERRKLQEILTQAPALIAVTREPGHVFDFANPVYVRTSGRSAEQLIGRPFHHVFPELAGQGVFDILDRVYESGEPFVGAELFLRIDRRGGGELEDTYWDLIYQPLRRADGAVEGIITQAFEVTERVEGRRRTRELLEQVAERETRLRVLIEQVPAILWTTDRDLRISVAMGAALPSLGLENDQVVGQTLHEYFGTDDPASEPIAQSIRALGGESVGFEYDWRDRTFQCSVEPLRDSGGIIAGTIGVAYEVTDRNLRLLQEEFVALASHELRTPLTPLQSYLQLLLRRLGTRPEDEDPRRYAERALEQVRLVSRLVNDLVDVTRLASGKYELRLAPVQLEEFVTRMVEVAQTLAHGQAIELQADGEELCVTADADRLQQVLLNLLQNAVTYAPGTDRIEVRLRREAADAVIEVRDHGPGIPAGDLSHIFSRFFQVAHAERPHGGGLGLGLYIARQIVEAHDGSISAASPPGEGATFTVRLPLAG